MHTTIPTTPCQRAAQPRPDRHPEVSQPPGAASLHAGFLAILPRIERHGSVYFRHLTPDRKEEAIAEMVALSWLWFYQLAQRGKDATQFPSVLGNFAARAIQAGRRLCGQLKPKDALSWRAQRRHGFAVESLPASTATTQEARYAAVRGQHHQDVFEERLQDNTQSPVPEQVAFRIDFPAWRRTHTERTRRIMDGMIIGDRTQDLARQFGISPARISQIRRELHDDWIRFIGEAS